MKSNRLLVAILFLLAFCQTSFSQEDAFVLDKIADFPYCFFDQMQIQSSNLEEKIIANTERPLQRLAEQEAGIKKKQKYFARQLF